MEKIFDDCRYLLDPKNSKLKPGEYNACVLNFIVKFCEPINWPDTLWDDFNFGNTSTGENWGIWRRHLEQKIIISSQSIVKKSDTPIIPEYCDKLGSKTSFFSQHVIEYIAFIIDFVEKRKINGRSGWNEHLKSYDWPGLQEGLNTRKNFFDKISYQLKNYDENSWKELCEEIRVWSGNNTPLDKGLSIRIFKIIIYLKTVKDKEQLDRKMIISKRIATLSKIYAFSDPRFWTIYDSRVGYSLNQFSFLFQNENIEIYNRIKSFVNFPVPPDRYGLRISLLKDNDKKNKEESRDIDFPLWFIRTSWLFQEIAKRLNNQNFPRPIASFDNDDSWQVYHVEMIFFMLGKDPNAIVDATLS